MNDTQPIMSVTKVKRMFLDILRTMQEDDSTITLTKNGEPVGVMMTSDRYEALLETIEVLADRKILSTLSASTRDFKKGKVCSDKEVWGE